MRFCAVILSGGVGKRFCSDEKKQNVFLKGKPVWRWVYDAVESLFDETVIVGRDVPRGETRQESVSNGIFSIDDGDYVVIFDAVRPLVTQAQIREIKAAVLEHPSVSFGLEPTDTILSRGEYMRKGLIALQVPQAFDLKKLKEAHATTKLKDCTDDTVIFANVHRIEPKIINGGLNLHKMTYPDDLKLLETICPM